MGRLTRITVRRRGRAGPTAAARLLVVLLLLLVALRLLVLLFFLLAVAVFELVLEHAARHRAAERAEDAVVHLVSGETACGAAG